MIKVQVEENLDLSKGDGRIRITVRVKIICERLRGKGWGGRVKGYPCPLGHGHGGPSSPNCV